MVGNLWCGGGNLWCGRGSVVWWGSVVWRGSVVWCGELWCGGESGVVEDLWCGVGDLRCAGLLPGCYHIGISYLRKRRHQYTLRLD